LDGSSSKTVIDGREEAMYYDHPDFKNYKPEFRVKQIAIREAEISEAREKCLEAFDVDIAFVGGFSYGAATAALTATKNPALYAGAILHDGWFHIDLSKSSGFESDFPSEAHANGIPVPCLFLGSTHFKNIEKLSRATKRLQDKSSAEVHVLPGTNHGNFSDVVWWIPNKILHMVRMIGPSDPHDTYETVLTLTLNFITAQKLNQGGSGMRKKRQ